ncbi:MAG: endonuclease III [Ignavibacteriales bacterium]|nr:endonuclease III [Ignavibacteriales bacterium]
MESLIKKIDSLLREYYGVPKRSEGMQNPLDVLIGTILSQNTNDKNSWRAYRNLKDKYSSWEEVRQLDRKELEEEIKVAGLGKQKSAAILEVLNDLFEKKRTLNLDHTQAMEDSDILDELTSYKGVGVKTASCVLLFSLRRNVCPVDTHVNRIVNRVGLVSSNQPEKTFNYLLGKIPDGLAHSFHSNLILLGREFCKPTNPDCSNCPLLQICEFKEKNTSGDEKKYPHNNFLLLDNL